MHVRLRRIRRRHRHSAQRPLDPRDRSSASTSSDHLFVQIWPDPALDEPALNGRCRGGSSPSFRRRPENGRRSSAQNCAVRLLAAPFSLLGCGRSRATAAAGKSLADCINRLRARTPPTKTCPIAQHPHSIQAPPSRSCASHRRNRTHLSPQNRAEDPHLPATTQAPPRTNSGSRNCRWSQDAAAQEFYFASVRISLAKETRFEPRSFLIGISTHRSTKKVPTSNGHRNSLASRRAFPSAFRSQGTTIAGPLPVAKVMPAAPQAHLRSQGEERRRANTEWRHGGRRLRQAPQPPRCRRCIFPRVSCGVWAHGPKPQQTSGQSWRFRKRKR